MRSSILGIAIGSQYPVCWPMSHVVGNSQLGCPCSPGDRAMLRYSVLRTLSGCVSNIRRAPPTTSKIYRYAVALQYDIKKCSGGASGRASWISREIEIAFKRAWRYRRPENQSDSSERCCAARTRISEVPGGARAVRISSHWFRTTLKPRKSTGRNRPKLSCNRPVCPGLETPRQGRGRMGNPIADGGAKTAAPQLVFIGSKLAQYFGITFAIIMPHPHSSCKNPNPPMGNPAISATHVHVSSIFPDPPPCSLGNCVSRRKSP